MTKEKLFDIIWTGKSFIVSDENKRLRFDIPKRENLMIILTENYELPVNEAEQLINDTIQRGKISKFILD